MAAPDYLSTRTAEALFGAAVTDDLTTARAALQAAGIAYIPVLITPRDDGGYGKTPRLNSWGRYLRHAPTIGELQSWLDAGLFTRPGKGCYAGIAALLTPYSRVIAVDLDHAPLIDAFTAQFDLPTYTEQTVRGGLHLLYRLPPDAAYPRTMKQAGRGELLAGRYMVIAPTPGYTAIAGNVSAIRTLTTDEYAALLAYFGPTRAAPDEQDVTPAPGQQTAPEAVLREFQRRAATTGSRNQALFDTLTAVRDAGIEQHAARAILKQAFIDAPGQHREADTARADEFERTLTSAYSRPARRPRHQGMGLHNVVRERLIKLQDGAVVARFVDACHYAGAAGTPLTVGEFAAALADITTAEGRPVFNQRSIERALMAHNVVSRICDTNATLTTHVVDTASQGLHSCRELPRPDDSTDKTARAGRASGQQQGACAALGLKASQPRRASKGRRPLRHRVPTAEEWRLWLGITDGPTESDNLPPAAFETVASYKRAIHAALIARRPGQYARRLLADRVNVDPVTVWRWNKQLGITPEPRFERTPLTAALADTLPHAGTQTAPGWWIELWDGTRIAPYRERAASLLAAGIPAQIVKQVASYYSIAQADDERGMT